MLILETPVLFALPQSLTYTYL